MIIGTCGFSWSGSSAVADLLMEFSDIQVYDKIEFLLAYFPDGLEDLDFHLNKNCSKFLSSTVAIPRFRKVANYLLNKPTKGQIKELTEKYLDSITQVTWKGLGQGQILVHNYWMFDHVGKKFTYKFLRRLPVKLCKKINLYPLSNMEFSVCPDNFNEVTLEYTDAILRAIGLDLSRPIVLDQPFAGNDPVKSLKYYRDAKAIIVDRDPRDLYLLAKEYFPKTSYQVPYENVKDFIAYYSNMHKTINNSIENSNILYIRFEELVYEYEATVNRIMEFLKIYNHDLPRKYFVPEQSMVNTRLYIKTNKYSNDIMEIEKTLSQYLYDFDNHSDIFKNEDNDKKIFDKCILSDKYSWRK
jgi:hypothetical protein